MDFYRPTVFTTLLFFFPLPFIPLNFTATAMSGAPSVPQPINYNFYTLAPPVVAEAAASRAGAPPADAAAKDAGPPPSPPPPPTPQRYVQGNPTWSRPRHPVPTGNPVDRDQCIIL